MPRLRALVLLGLFLVNHVACTSWQLPKVTPQHYVEQRPGTKVRITPKDELGKPQRTVVLREVYFARDSVFGRDPKGQPLAYSLPQVAPIEVHGANRGRTTLLLVVGVPLTVLGGLVILFAATGGCCSTSWSITW